MKELKNLQNDSRTGEPYFAKLERLGEEERRSYTELQRLSPQTEAEFQSQIAFSRRMMSENSRT